MRRLLSFILIISMISNYAYSSEGKTGDRVILSLSKKYKLPAHKFIRVTPERLEEIKNDPLYKDRLKIREIKKDELLAKSDDEEPEEYEYEPVDYGDREVIRSAIEVGFRSSGSSGDGALAFFAVVGAFIVVLWVIYTVVYIIEAFSYIEAFHPWMSLEYFASVISDSFKPGNTFRREGFMHGVEIMSGINETRRIQLGLTGQFGKHFIRDTIFKNGSNERYYNHFWLAGPNIIIGLGEKSRSTLMYIDLMFGNSFDREVKEIASARFGFKFHFSHSIMFGINWGGIYFDAAPQRGMAKSVEKYDYIWGCTLGLRF